MTPVNFYATLNRYIAREGQTFTLGLRDIPARQISFTSPGELCVDPVTGHHGVALVWVPCQVAGDSDGYYWLRVKTVDERISAVSIALVEPEPNNQLRPPAG